MGEGEDESNLGRVIRLLVLLCCFVVVVVVLLHDIQGLVHDVGRGVGNIYYIPKGGVHIQPTDNLFFFLAKFCIIIYDFLKFGYKTYLIIKMS